MRWVLARMPLHGNPKFLLSQREPRIVLAKQYIKRPAQPAALDTSKPFLLSLQILRQAALQEFRIGSPDRGRYIFENLLRNYPKRTDLWSVYIDQVSQNYSEADRSRRPASHKALSVFTSFGFCAGAKASRATSSQKPVRKGDRIGASSQENEVHLQAICGV